MVINNYDLYLISPSKIDDINDFIRKLENIFINYNIKIFQLRIKNTSHSLISSYIANIKPICNKYNISFVINDYIDLAISNNIYNIHLGFDDFIDFLNNKKYDHIRNKIKIGVSCYNSKAKSLFAYHNNVDYISFGGFFKSFSKEINYKSDKSLLVWANKYLTNNYINYSSDNKNTKIIVIGGIDESNINFFNKEYIDYAALIKYFWK